MMWIFFSLVVFIFCLLSPQLRGLAIRLGIAFVIAGGLFVVAIESHDPVSHQAKATAHCQMRIPTPPPGEVDYVLIDPDTKLPYPFCD